ncbi:MAG: AsnC family protein [Verrucomicrobiota bacterium]
MEYAQKLITQIEDLKKQLDAIGGKQNQLNELNAKKAALKNDLAEIEKQINALEKELGGGSRRGSSKRAAGSAGGTRRPRMSADEISSKILNHLQQNRGGVSQREISAATGVSYPAVIKFLKANSSKVRTEGSRRSSRVFLQ